MCLLVHAAYFIPRDSDAGRVLNLLQSPNEAFTYRAVEFTAKNSDIADAATRCCPTQCYQFGCVCVSNEI